MDTIGYIASLIIGISLGLIGGGGSILTMPVLVYLFRINPVVATSYSLFIVGSTSLIGAVPKYWQGLVSLRTALIFGIPSIAAVYLIRKFVVPNIPEVVFSWSGIAFSRDLLTMLLFAVLMVFASISMIRDKHTKTTKKENKEQQFSYTLIFGEGLLVGSLTGLVGAGGGFLIIPALVLLSKLPIKQAIGTSLLIIAAKSLIGFTGDLDHFDMDWNLLATITTLAVCGIFIGNWLSNLVDGAKLKKGFGWFVLVMGFYIILKELVL